MPRPASQPRTGIRAWKPPKNSPILSALGTSSLFIVAPLAMATANASSDKASAIRNISVTGMR